MAKNKPKHPEIYIAPNKEQTEMILRALEALPDKEKGSVVYQKLLANIKNMNTIWERRTKNEKLLSGEMQPKSPPERRWSTK